MKNNNISIIIGAVIISITIFFTFEKETKVSKNDDQAKIELSETKNAEYKLLEERLELMKERILTMNSNNRDVDALKNEIETLKNKLAVKDLETYETITEIRDEPMIYDFTVHKSAVAVHDGFRETKNGTLYKIYDESSDSLENEMKEVAKNDNYKGGVIYKSPSSPIIASVEIEGEKVYYQVKTEQKEVSTLVVSQSEGGAVVLEQTSSEVSGGMPSPPSLDLPQPNK